MAALPACHTGKSIVQDTTIKKAVHDLPDIRPEKAILPLKAFIIDLFKCFEIYPPENDPISDDICIS